MSQYIVTRLNEDGTYDNVETNNCILFSQYRTLTGALRHAIKPFANGGMVRVEIFNDGVYGRAPNDTRYYNFG